VLSPGVPGIEFSFMSPSAGMFSLCANAGLSIFIKLISDDGI